MTQPIDQLQPGAGRQAVHPHGRVARIVEIVDHVERQAVAVRQPFDQHAGALRHRIDDGGIRLAFRLALDVGGEQLRAVGDAFGALETRAAAGMSPADSAVEPAGTASRSMTTASMPASFAASAAHSPAAPAPTISSGTSTSKFASNE